MSTPDEVDPSPLTETSRESYATPSIIVTNQQRSSQRGVECSVCSFGISEVETDGWRFDTHASAWVRIFSGYCAGCFLLCLFFVENYWIVPWLLPLVFVTLVLFHAMSLKFGDLFCNVPVRVTVGGNAGHYQVIMSLFDIVSSVAFLFGALLLIFILAPIWRSWRSLQVSPIEWNFNPALLARQNFAKGPIMFSSRTRVGDIIAINPYSGRRVAARKKMFQWPSGKNETALDFNESYEKEGFDRFARRLWPNLYFPDVPTPRAAAAPLYFGWGNFEGASRSGGWTEVWAGCSDAASLGCSCRGELLTPLRSPASCQAPEGWSALCGWQLPPGMARHNGITDAVRAHKLAHEIPRRPRTTILYICLTDPFQTRRDLTADVTTALGWGSLTFIAGFFMAVRLVVFYLCEDPEMTRSRDYTVLDALGV